MVTTSHGIFESQYQVDWLVGATPPVLWRCWLGGRKGIRHVINLSGGVLVWLYVWSEMQTCIWPTWCHCHSLSLAPVKSRLVLPFWYRLTQVVKGLLNRCVCVVEQKNRTENTTSRFITDQCPGFHVVWLIVLQFNDCRVRTLLEVIVRVKPNLRLLTTTATQQRSYVNSPTISHKQGSEFSWTSSHCKLTETAAFYFVSTQHASHAHIVAT